MNNSILFCFVLVFSFSCQTNIEKTKNEKKLNELLSKSEILYKCYQYDKALELFNQIIEIDSNIGIVYFRRSNCYAVKSEWGNSIKDDLKCVKLGYRVESSFKNIGLSYEAVSDYPHALYYYIKAHELNPKDSVVNKRINFIKSLRLN